MAESEQQSACSEDTNSICDEERVRKLFQACDGDGDGYIDRQVLFKHNVIFNLRLEPVIANLTVAGIFFFILQAFKINSF